MSPFRGHLISSMIVVPNWPKDNPRLTNGVPSYVPEFHRQIFFFTLLSLPTVRIIHVKTCPNTLTESSLRDGSAFFHVSPGQQQSPSPNFRVCTVRPPLPRPRDASRAWGRPPLHCVATPSESYLVHSFTNHSFTERVHANLTKTA